MFLKQTASCIQLTQVLSCIKGYSQAGKMENSLGRLFMVFTENPEKPLESDRCVSYRIYLTFWGVCQYLSAYLVTFILLNESIKV